jgi:precorrin-4/cobalt-precorrin-4 C11-methyltransferase
MTIKAQRALTEADLIIYAGSLVPEAVLIWAKPEAVKMNSASMVLEDISAEIGKAYHDGNRVVRLHTGEPSLYGAIFEQMAELAKRDIPYMVIPGVTAAFAAAAAMGIEYTLPQVSQTLILTRMAGRTPVPEKESLELLASHQTTMAIYLSIRLIDEVEQILKNAYGADAPCVVAFRVSQPEEKILWTTISKLSQTVRDNSITHQAVIIVGKVLEVSISEMKHYSKLYDKDFQHGYRQ